MNDDLGTLPPYPFSALSPLDPPAEFSRLRTESPISRVRLGSGEVAWLLTRYVDIRTASAASRLTTWFPGMSAGVADEDTSGLLFLMNGPTHVRLRRILSKALSPHLIEDLRPKVQHIVQELLGDLSDGDHSADLIADFAATLSIAVLSELLGIPIAARDGFRDWSNAMLAVFSAPTPEEMAQAGEKLPAFIAELIDTKRNRPDNDLLSELIAASDGECNVLSDIQLQNLVLTLLLAGYVPAANAMSLAIVQLLRHPDQHEALRVEPALIDTAVDELLRIDQGSNTDQLRIATADIEIGGVTIRSGEVVVAPLRCANRDPEVFASPDQVDFSRTENSHLAFAHGPHHCLGAALARLQLRIGIGALVASFPLLRLAEPFEDLHWHTMFFTLNGPRALPVIW